MRFGDLVERFGAGRILGSVVLVAALAFVGARAIGVTDDFVVGSSPGKGVATAEEEADATRGEAIGADAGHTVQSVGATATRVVVHVAGSVLRPGVYELPAGSRVVDALESAGGESSDAELAAVNLASSLEDGSQVYIPSRKEVEDGWISTAQTSAAATGSGLGAAGQSVRSGGPVNINTAGVAELDTLPGIGQVTAGKIVADRTSNGPFNSLDDLGRISGIGDAKIGALEGLAVAR